MRDVPEAPRGRSATAVLGVLTGLGIPSDRLGLATPVLATGIRLTASGGVLLWGRTALECDLETAAGSPVPAGTPGSTERRHG